jgi:hypothetical protein
VLESLTVCEPLFPSCLKNRIPLITPAYFAVKATPTWTGVDAESGEPVGWSVSSKTVHGQIPGEFAGRTVVKDHWYGAAIPMFSAVVAETVAVYLVLAAIGWAGVNLAVRVVVS